MPPGPGERAEYTNLDPLTGGATTALGGGTGQAVGWSPLSVYDMPGLMAYQILVRTRYDQFWNMVLNPDRLSLADRQTLAEGITDEPGLLRAAIGVATNPWFLMAMVATNPVGRAALRAGRALFHQTPEFSRTVSRTTGWWRMLLTPMEHFGNDVGKVLTGIVDRITDLTESSAAAVAPAEAALMKKIESVFRTRYSRRFRWASPGTGSVLDPRNYGHGTPEHELLRELNVALAVRALKLDKLRGVHAPKYEVDQIVTFPRVFKSIQEAEEAGYKPVPVDVGSVPRTPRAFQAVIMALNSPEKRKELFQELSDKGRELQRQGSIRQSLQELVGQYFPALSGKVTSDEEAFRLWVMWQMPRYKIIGRLEEVPRVRFPQVDKDWVDSVLGQYGTELQQYLKTTQAQILQRLIRMVGDEAVWERDRRVVLDDAKVEMIAYTLSRIATREGKGPMGLDLSKAGKTSVEGMDALISTVGVQKLTGEDPRANLRKLLEKVLPSPDIDPLERVWLPPNLATLQPIYEGGKRIPLDSKLNAVQRVIMQNAPSFSEASLIPAGLAPSTGQAIKLHLDDYYYLRKAGALTREGINMYKRVYGEVADRWKRQSYSAPANPAGLTMGQRLSYVESYDRWMAGSAQFHAFSTMRATQAMLDEDAELARVTPPARKGARIEFGLRGERAVAEPIAADDMPYVSPAYLLDRFKARLQNAYDARLFEDTVLPGALNMAGPEWVAMHNAQLRAREQAAWFANSWLGRAIEKFGPQSRAFIENLRALGDPSRVGQAPSITSGLAKWLYASHLGINLSSMILNLTQPLLLASSIARPHEVLAAYREAFGEMVRYARLRSALGPFPSRHARAQAVREAFQDHDLLGIGPALYTALDMHLSRSASAMDRMFEVMMKGFEKTEWFNRVVTGKLVKQAYLAVGRNPATDPHFRDDVRRMTWQTQFGAHPMNVPLVFERVPFLRNPLGRMFLTFPLRSLTGAVYTIPLISAADMTGDLQTRYLKGLGNVFLRQMGTSAVVNEVSKHLLGADFQRGLFWEATTELLPLGGDSYRMARIGDMVPLPPILSVPLDYVRAGITADQGLLGSAIARSVPGGVSLMRMAGLAGPLSFGGPDTPANTADMRPWYVDWRNRTEDGRVAVYNRSGNLMEYVPPSLVLARAFGVDLGAWGRLTDFDRYISTQKREIQAARNEWIRLHLANDPSGAEQVRLSFEKRFRVPLTVSQRHIDNWLMAQETSRTERVLQGVPTGYREQLMQAAVQEGRTGRFTPEQFLAGRTIQSRRLEPFPGEDRSEPVASSE